MIGTLSRVRAGKLKRLVSIQQKSTTGDSFGGVQFTWSEIKKVYADIEALTGRELLAAEALASEVSHKITVRYDAIFVDPKLAAGYRVVYQSRIFDLAAVMNADEGDRVIVLLAQEGLTQGG